MRLLRTPSILGAIIAGVLAVAPAPAFAQVSLTVSPALLELHGHPGDVGRIPISVTASGDEAVTIVTSVGQLAQMSGDHSAVHWSTVSPQRTTLQAGANAQVTYEVRIPDDAASGGRYALVSISTVPVDAPAGASAMAGRIEVPVFLTVEGREDLMRQPVTITRAAMFLALDGTIDVRVDVANGGNVHVPLVGEVEVTAVDQSPAPSPSASPSPLPIPMGRVLPGTTRTYAATGQLSLPLDKPYDVTARVGPPADDDPNRMADVIQRFSAQVSPSVAVSIPSLTMCAGPDGLEVTAQMANEGTLGVDVAATFDVRDPSGASVGAIGGSPQAPSWPGSVIDIGGLIPPGLPDGAWSVVAQVTVGDGQQAELALPFVLGDPATQPAACDATTDVASASPAASPASSEVPQP
jgi:hypothetical protein